VAIEKEDPCSALPNLVNVLSEEKKKLKKKLKIPLS